MTDQTARELLYRHGLPEDVIDGALCLHAQEMAAQIRALDPVEAALAGAHAWSDAAALIDPTKTAPAVVSAPVQPTDRADDRAAVLRDEAALIRAHCPDHLDSNSAEGSWMFCHCDVADDMIRRAGGKASGPEICELPHLTIDEEDACETRRVAGEEQPATETQAVASLQQEVKRLGLMVDEYGTGASALTDKLKRIRDVHRETCLYAKGELGSPAFVCSMCEVLDAPAAVVARQDGATT